MAGRYTTVDGDALDLICYRHYGQRAGAAEAVLEANPHIAAIAHKLPLGIVITLPDLGADAGTAALRLWD